METLETLSKFTEKYPQTSDGKLQYSFLGGTAVRLHQEQFNSKDKRPISDFDLLVFNSDNFYPVHNCSIDNVFGVISGKEKEFDKYVISTKIQDKDYYFMNGTFLTLTKTCAIDNPREKDFKDIQILYSNNLIDFEELNSLYLKAERLIKRPNLSVNTLRWILEHPTSDNIRLFQTFPRLVNLVGEFEDTIPPEEAVSSYVHSDQNKDGYALASVVYNVHSFLREFKESSEGERLVMMKKLLKIAKKNDYIDFDRIVNWDLIPKARYSSPKSKNF
jgi:hypothetical protein